MSRACTSSIAGGSASVSPRAAHVALRCYGRYDVALVPMDGAAGTDPAVVIEFKVFDPRREKTLADTVARARQQIDDKAYVAGLVARGIVSERVHTYGIAFRGKEVLIG